MADDLLTEYGTVARLIALRDLLLAATCDQFTIFTRLPDFYPNKPASKKKIARDIQSLRALGYEMECNDHPLSWRIIPSLILTETDMRTLRIISDAFGERHPFSQHCQQFVYKLTQNLTPVQQRAWDRPVFSTNMLVPVRDYAPFGAAMEMLNTAIELRQQVKFLYTKPGTKLWHTVDPYQIALRDRQYYLEAYSYAAGKSILFRIDRIAIDLSIGSPEILASRQRLPRQRPPVQFVYQLSHALAAGGVSARFDIERTESTSEGVIVHARDYNELFIVRTLLGYGEHIVLLDGPATLVERFQREVRALYKNHIS